MSKNTVNYILLTGFFVSVVLMFWPFAQWNDAASLILRIMPSISVQLLVCRLTQNKFFRAIPVFVSAAIALWGIYLYCTSPSWSNATFGGLTADYISMFICCLTVYLIYRARKER